MITNETKDFINLDFQTGEIILIDKPFKWSSFKVIHEVRKVIGTRKVGHAGTLDPMATGLLIIASGKKTKEISAFQSLEKTYCGTISLGKTSPSFDMETNINSESSYDNVSKEEIYAARDNFIGKVLQTPPMYSAVKFKGKSLYKIARKGREIPREPREVNISRFEIKSISLPNIEFEITCSKGTYIRVIANDFGENLGCGALLSSLRRTAIGDYQVEKALTVEEFVKEMKSLKKPQEHVRI
jgi:tRNA pseudouridine55 synthase